MSIVTTTGICAATGASLSMPASAVAAGGAGRVPFLVLSIPVA